MVECELFKISFDHLTEVVGACKSTSGLSGPSALQFGRVLTRYVSNIF